MSSEKDATHLWDDERITAYVMNELDDQQRTAFETELSGNPALAEAVEKARMVAEKLENFFGSMPNEMLDDERLERLLSEQPPVHSELVSTQLAPERPSPWLGLLIAASIVFVLAAISIPVVTSNLSPMQEVAMQAGIESDDAAMQVPVPDESVTENVVKESDASSLDALSSAATIGTETEKYRADRNAKENEAKLADEIEESVSSMLMAKKPSEPVELSPASPYAPDLQVPVAPAAMDKGMDIGMRMESPGKAEIQKRISPRPAAVGLSKQLSRKSDQSDNLGDYALSSKDSTIRLRVEATTPARGRTVEKEIAEGLRIPDERPVGPGDRYETIVENTFKRVAEHPLSTLSIDVDTASYSKVRMALQRNQLPPADAVRIEEMINYFEYDYEKVSDTLSSETGKPDPFSASLDVAECPWEPEHRLVRVGLQAVELDKQERPRCNLVFLIDTSGSMMAANKLPLLIDGMKLLVKELRPDDRVAIVVYAGSAGLVLDSTPAKKRKKIIGALSQLRAGGSTNGGAGLRLAYETAREHFLDKGVNRVILCSDGDFNVGMTGTGELVREAKSQAKSGIDLTVLGFGMGNHNDAMMERISNDAEGNYAFIDTIAESKKVLVDQLSGTLVTVAKDVKIQIEFNPAVVSSYRLIGYENRLLAKEDFNDDTKDAGEIGAGHRVTALYQVVPVGAKSPTVSPNVDPLKYQPSEAVEVASEEEPVAAPENLPDAEVGKAVSREMLTLKLRYKPPQGDKSTLMTRTLTDDGGEFIQAGDDFRFAAAVAGFGMLLRNSPMAGAWAYDDVMRVAAESLGTDEHGLREEMIELVATAKRLSE